MKLKFEFNKNKDGLVIKRCEDIEGELVIPSEQEYEGKMYPVTEIGNGARSWERINPVKHKMP